MTLMVTADHGPAVSGAHNTIVCARAGKDLVSCLASGLLTIVSNNLHIYNSCFHSLFRAIVSVVHSIMLLNSLVKHLMQVYIQLLLLIKCVKKEILLWVLVIELNRYKKSFSKNKQFYFSIFI